MDCGRFTDVHILTAIGRDVLKEFLGRFEAELAARDVSLPAEALPDEEYFKGLRQLLMRPEGLPEGINDALHAVVELATPEGYERLKTAIRQSSVKIAYDERSTPEDIALKVWLAAPDIMARQYNEQRLGRLSRFDYYEMDPADFFWSNPRAGGEGDMDALVGGLDRWFEANDRGAETTIIERYEFNGEEWYLIRHGDSMLRSSKVEKRRREILHYRPAKDDVVVYSRERDELRINAKTKGEKELYRVMFGCYLTRYGGYFREARTYTLEPLRTLQKDALECSDIPGLASVVLTGVDVDFGNGQGQGCTLRADDIFACQWTSGVTGLTLPAKARLKRAAFSILLQGEGKPLEVQIRPPNTLRLARHSAAALVHKWATARGFKGGKPARANPV
jgi:hypothetical protein